MTKRYQSSSKSRGVSDDDLKTPGYFIFVAADGDRSRIAFPSAFELAQNRLQKSTWGMADRTRYRRQLKPGDHALIYVSGHRELAQHFIAAAQLKSLCLPVRHSERGEWDAITQIDAHPYKVELKNIKYFPQPLAIKPFIEKLSFIKPEHHKLWRIYFQGGVAKIPESDFRLLLHQAR